MVREFSENGKSILLEVINISSHCSSEVVSCESETIPKNKVINKNLYFIFIAVLLKNKSKVIFKYAICF